MFLDPLRPLFLCVFLAGTVLPLFSLLAERFLLKRSSASTRHRLWTLTAIALLLFPGIVLAVRGGVDKPAEVAPAVRNVEPVPAEPVFSGPDSDVVANRPVVDPGFSIPESMPAGGVSPPIDGVPEENKSVAEISFDLKVLATQATAFWLVGVALFFLYFTALHFRSLFVLSRFRREDETVFDADNPGRGIRLLFSDKTSIPFAFGLRRPTIVFPAEAKDWPKEKMHAVLLHEKAHILRRDLLWQHVVCATCTFYWFHPFVWHLARRIRIEQERACDDMVLESGQRSSDYASVLLELSKNLVTNRPVPEGGLAMVRRKTVVKRIDSILDEKTSRKPIGLRATLGILLGVFLLSVGVSFFAPRITLPVLAQDSKATEADRPDTKSNDFRLGEERKIEIRGRILMPDGAPAPKSWLVTQQTSGWSNVTSTNSSDENGVYTDKVHVGAYYLALVRKPIKTGTPADDLASSVVATIVTDPPTPGQFDIRLEKGIRAHGAIRYENGKPAVGKTVSFMVYPFGRETVTTFREGGANGGSSVNLPFDAISDENGDFRKILRPGEYVVSVRGLYGETRERTIVLKSEDKEFRMDFTLPEPTEGRILLPDGSPAANLEIGTVVFQGENSTLHGRVKTDDDGRFTADLSPYGNMIHASTKDGKFGLVRYVDVEQRKDTLTLVLQPPATGKVRIISSETGKPIAGHPLRYSVKLETPSGNSSDFPIQTQTDSEGRVVLDRLYIGGKYELSFQSPTGVHSYPTLQCEFEPKVPGEVVDLGEKRIHGDFKNYEAVETTTSQNPPVIKEDRSELQDLLARNKKQSETWSDRNRGKIKWTPEEQRKFLDDCIETSSKILTLPLDEKTKRQMEQGRGFWIRMVALDDYEAGKERYEKTIAELEKIPGNEKTIKNYRSEIFAVSMKGIMKKEDYADRLAELKKEIKAEFETDPEHAAFRASAMLMGVRAYCESTAMPFDEVMEFYDTGMREFVPYFKRSADPNIRSTAEYYEGKLRFRDLVGKKLDLEGILIDGQKFDWNSYRGKPVLVYFNSPDGDTDEYCSLAYFTDAFHRVDEKYRDKGLQFVGYGMVFPTERRRYPDGDLLKAMNRAKLPGVMISGNKSLDAGYKPMNVYYGCTFSPCVLLVDRDGTVLSTRIGHVHKNFADKNGEVELDHTLRSYFETGKVPEPQVYVSPEKQEILDREKNKARWMFLRNELLPDVERLISAKITAAEFADGMAALLGKLLVHDARIVEARRNRIQTDLARFIKERLPDDLSSDQRRNIVEGTLHFTAFSIIDRPYNLIPELLENLRWRIATVLREQPLSETDRAKLEEQIDFMRKFVTDYPMGDKNSYNSERKKPEQRLAQLDGFVTDSFCPFFKKPFGDEQWEKFLKNLERCKKSGFGSQGFRAVGILCNAIGFTDYPTTKNPGSVDLTDDGPIMGFRHLASGMYTNIYAYDNDDKARRTAGNISNPGYRPLDLEAHKNMFSDPGRTITPIGRNEAVKIAREKNVGDILYDGTANELVGVDGTVFAPLSCTSREESDRLSDGDLQKLLDEKGVAVYSLGPITPDCENGVCRPVLKKFLVARNGKRDMSVIELVSIRPMSQAMEFRKTNPDTNLLSRLAEVEGNFFPRPIPPDALPEDRYAPEGVMRKIR